MLRISWFLNLFSLFTGQKADGKASFSQEQQEDSGANNLPSFAPTSFTEAQHLPALNRLRQEEILKTSFTTIKPREDYETREQAFLHRMQERIFTMTDLELHEFVSSQENDPIVRRMGAAELVNRGDSSAWLTFVFCIVDSDDDAVLRKICAIGLGELGKKEFLGALKGIKEDDWIFDDAQEAIKKIKAHETSIMVLVH